VVSAITATSFVWKKFIMNGDGGSVIHPLPLMETPEIADTFSADAIIAALKAIQERRTDYALFLTRGVSCGEFPARGSQF